MSRLRVVGALAFLSVPLPATADFVDAGFCPSLRAAYAAGKQSAAALRSARIAWGDCKIRDDGTLSCTRHFGDEEEGRRADAALKTATAACLAPLGLRPRVTMIGRVESERFDGAARDPSVTVQHLETLVMISVITPD